MTSQEIMQALFDKSTAHVLAQGKPSGHWVEKRDALGGTTKEFRCLYRSPEGLGCGAQPFIRDYVPEMEAKGWANVATRFKDRLDPDAVANIVLVNILQAAHDEAAPLAPNGGVVFLYQYKQRIREAAAHFCLRVPEGV